MAVTQNALITAKCVTAFPEMRTYSNLLFRGLTKNEIQTLHEDSLKGATVKGEMWVSAEFSPLFK